MSSWDSALLGRLPHGGHILRKGDERMAPYCGDVVMTGDPDAVLRARDTQEICEVLAFCDHHAIPVTFLGGQTGLTGAAAASEGVAVATENLKRVLEIAREPAGGGYAVAEPGVLLEDLKEQVAREGLFYPPDPTSYREARLGGTVATNAKGEDAVQYGDTRRYIEALKVVQANGQWLHWRRPADNEMIDATIGSEGTLGFLAEITVRLLPAPPEHWGAIAFFPSLAAALAFGVRSLQSQVLAPRALELLDGASLAIWRDFPYIPPVPDKATAAIYWKQEFRDSAAEMAFFERWMELLGEVLSLEGAAELVEATWVARTDAEKNRFRRWRHLIPSVINERLASFRAAGGGKVASDWWVPVSKLPEAMEQARRDAEVAGLEMIAFGHLGNGHPHINFIARNDQERRIGMKLLRQQCKRAVKWGGGVAGEHGFGKLFRDFLPIQYSRGEIRKMRELKSRYDPHWILGRGTLFT